MTRHTHCSASPTASMCRLTRMAWYVVFFILVAVCVQAPQVLHAQDAADQFSKYVDAKGNISLPDDFETQFVHIGTIAVATKKDQPVDELHGTYTRREDLAAFQRDGKFPDGAVLVKDVRAATGAKMTTGDASYAADVKIWFVMIKDAKGRFEGNDLWGDGWGWALFNGPDRKTQVATDYRTDCRSCHVPAKKNDWLYTQCYPALVSKNAGAAGTK